MHDSLEDPISAFKLRLRRTTFVPYLLTLHIRFRDDYLTDVWILVGHRGSRHIHLVYFSARLGQLCVREWFPICHVVVFDLCVHLGLMLERGIVRLVGHRQPAILGTLRCGCVG